MKSKFLWGFLVFIFSLCLPLCFCYGDDGTIPTFPIQVVAGYVTDQNTNPVGDASIQIKYGDQILGETITYCNGYYRILVGLPEIFWDDEEERYLSVVADKTLRHNEVPIVRFYKEEFFLLGHGQVPYCQSFLSVKRVDCVCEIQSLVPEVYGLHFLTETEYYYDFYGDASGYAARNAANRKYFVLQHHPDWGNGYASIGLDLVRDETIDVSGYDTISVIALVEADAPAANFWINLRDPSWTDWYHPQAHTQIGTIPAGRGIGRFEVIDLDLADLTNFWGNDGDIDLSQLCHVGIEFGGPAGNYNPLTITIYDIIFTNSSAKASRRRKLINKFRKE